MKKVVVTFGDFNGISPEICIKALNLLNLPSENVLLATNKNILDYYSENYNLKLNKEYEIIEIPCNKNDLQPGKETKEAGEFSYSALKKACETIKEKKAEAIVTAPVSKNAMHLAKHFFDGQTEIIENFLAKPGQKAEMLFTCKNFSVLLLTRHLALKDVPACIKKDVIIDKIIRTNDTFEKIMGRKNPKFALCALNPHAGENGLFGDEEINEIIPAVKELTSKGINVFGPYPSDTLFTSLNEDKYDCYVAMYHDQGLIPIKLTERDNCVNTTVGLDVLRTSPAHGTAFDIAGKNLANPLSMAEAIKSAIR